MNKIFKNGLIVGKFSPLHTGHEFLINHGRDICDNVYIISYSKPELPGCSRSTREQWLQQLFPDITQLVLDDDYLIDIALSRGISQIPEIPQNDDPEHTQRLFVGWLCLNILNVIVDGVITSEDYGDGFASALSTYFSERTGNSHLVRHVCVDKTRTNINISATQIRSDIFKYKQYISSVVYGSFIKQICFLGGESTGKTVLAQSLADALDTRWVPEYGRELWLEKEGQLQLEDMLKIGQIQISRETECLQKANRFLFCDTSPLTTMFYSLNMFGAVDSQLEKLSERQYDWVFLCVPDFLFVQDGTRQDKQFRQLQHEWYEKELSKRDISYTPLTGSIDERISTVIKLLM